MSSPHGRKTDDSSSSVERISTKAVYVGSYPPPDPRKDAAKEPRCMASTSDGFDINADPQEGVQAGQTEAQPLGGDYSYTVAKPDCHMVEPEDGLSTELGPGPYQLGQELSKKAEALTLQDPVAGRAKQSISDSRGGSDARGTSQSQSYTDASKAPATSQVAEDYLDECDEPCYYPAVAESPEQVPQSHPDLVGISSSPEDTEPLALADELEVMLDELMTGVPAMTRPSQPRLYNGSADDWSNFWRNGQVRGRATHSPASVRAMGRNSYRQRLIEYSFDPTYLRFAPASTEGFESSDPLSDGL